MRLTKYPQSCIVVDNGEGRVLIDPGTFALDAHSLDDFGHVDAVLYTHRHADHFDERHVGEIVERGIAVFANDDVAGLIGAACTVVADGERFAAAGFDVVARDLPHVEMVDGSPGPPNTGYVLDGTLFHPGDGRTLPGLTVPSVALPIAGPSISLRDAYEVVASLGAERVVPMHYAMFPADPRLFRQWCDLAEVVILADGDSTDL